MRPPAFILLLAAGCGSGAASLSTTEPDAHGHMDVDAAVAGPDAASDLAPPAAVTASESGHWIGQGPETVVPLDHTNTKVAAWSRASGQWQYFSGKGAADG